MQWEYPYVGWKGNRKVPWPTWNLPARATCPGSTPECRRTCYALKAERYYPAVLPCRLANLQWSLKDEFAERMIQLIRESRPKYFRIHESGDFYSPEYFLAWVKIAKVCPETRFFAYTKVRSIFDLERPDNFVLIWSIYPDTTERTPKGAAIFHMIPKGKGKRPPKGAIECRGLCGPCKLCPNAKSGTRIWIREH